MASSTLLSLPNVAKISRTCSCATLRVSLPTCSLVVLTSAARPPSFAAAFPSPPFVASSAFAGAFVLASFSGGRSAGSLAFAPLAAASLRSLGGGDRGGLVPEEVPLELDEPEPLPLPLLLPDPELEPELPEDDGDGDFLPAMAIAVGVRRGSRQAGGLQSPIDARISFLVHQRRDAHASAAHQERVVEFDGRHQGCTNHSEADFAAMASESVQPGA